MSLLISTWQKVFAQHDDGVEPILEAGAPFYGLTWDHDVVYVGARDWGRSEHDHLIILDRSLKQIDDYELPTGGALHQILWRDGWVYLTDTKADRILRWKPGEWETVMDLGTGEDAHHVNSLWHDGESWWAMGLYGHLWRDWRLFLRLGFQCHNVWKQGNQFVVGASDRQGLYVGARFVSLADPVGVMQEPSDLWQAYTRGLAVGDNIYVGAAAVQDERNERWQGNSAIVVYSHDWEPLRVLRYSDTGGMHDVRYIGLDLAHNGVRW